MKNVGTTKFTNTTTAKKKKEPLIRSSPVNLLNFSGPPLISKCEFCTL